MSDLTFSNRSIVDFKQKLTGGGARSNLFEVEIEYPATIAVDSSPEGPKEFGKFMIKAAEIPASNLGNIPVPFRGRVLPVAGDRTFDPWTVTVINDTNFRIRDAMEQWSNSINDLQTSQGSIDPAAYQTSAKVKQLSREGGNDPGNIIVLREYRFEGIYPNTISSIPLDYGATDQIEEFQATFNYLFYSVTDGTSVGDSGGNQGLI
tara:strand:+ start:66 stop:683 length:618 start_codon:yes stop_codon:yes gene_type:complete